MPTLVAAAGEPQMKEKLLAGYGAAGGASRCISTATTSATCSRGGPGKPREEIFYWTDDGNLAALRYDRWKSALPGAGGARLPGLAGAADARCACPCSSTCAADPYERAVHEAAEYGEVAGRARLSAGAGAGLRRPPPGDLPRVSAAAEARQLLAGSGAGEAAGRARRPESPIARRPAPALSTAPAAGGGSAMHPTTLTGTHMPNSRLDTGARAGVAHPTGPRLRARRRHRAAAERAT